MIKYKAESGYHPCVVKVEVVKETSYFYDILNGRREAKEGCYHKFFDTFEEGRLWLMERCDNEIQGYLSNIDRLKDKKRKINELKEK